MPTPKQKSKGFLKDLWEVYRERWLTHKALRLLNKQEWSIEFLSSMLVRASRTINMPLEMTIVGPGGVAVKVNTIDIPQAAVYNDDSIFNHLDDEVRMQRFMETLR